MPYIVRFRWHDLIDQEHFMDHLQAHTPGFKESMSKGYGAYGHPRFSDAKIIRPTSEGFAIVEFKGKVYNKSDINEYITNVKQHLRSWGIKDVEISEPEKVTMKEFESRDRIKKLSKAKPKRKVTKKCKCK